MSRFTLEAYLKGDCTSCCSDCFITGKNCFIVMLLSLLFYGGGITPYIFSLVSLVQKLQHKNDKLCFYRGFCEPGQ